MIAPHYAQGWSRAGAGEAPGCGMGMWPATVAVHQRKFPARRSYLPRRANCRDRQDSPAFFFTPVSVDPDEIHELRICELTGRQAVLSRALLSSAGADAGSVVPLSGNYSEPVRLGWRRFLPLRRRATAARAISRWAGALADWICLPEEQVPTPTPTPTTTSGTRSRAEGE